MRTRYKVVLRHEGRTVDMTEDFDRKPFLTASAAAYFCEEIEAVLHGACADWEAA